MLKDQYERGIMSQKFAIVANTTWNIYNFRLPLIRMLQKRGHEVIVLSPVDRYLHYLNSSCRAKHFHLKHLTSFSQNPFREWLAYREIYRIFKKERPDFVLSFTVKPNLYAGRAANQIGIPLIPTVTGLGYTFMHHTYVQSMVRKAYRSIAHQAKCIFFHNSDDRDLFVRENLSPASTSFVVNGSGINTNHFRPLQRSESSPFVFLFMGRLLQDKGIREYVTAAKRLKALGLPVECRIVGEFSTQHPSGMTRDTFLQWVNEGTIKYFGSSSDVRPHLKETDVFVLPSYREGMPRSILEAMAMEIPVITTDVAGCRQTIDASCGWSVKAGDPKSLENAMLEAYAMDPAERQRMGWSARNRVRNCFSEQQILAAYEQVLFQEKAKKSVATR